MVGISKKQTQQGILDGCKSQRSESHKKCNKGYLTTTGFKGRNLNKNKICNKEYLTTTGFKVRNLKTNHNKGYTTTTGFKSQNLENKTHKTHTSGPHRTHVTKLCLKHPQKLSTPPSGSKSRCVPKSNIELKFGIRILYFELLI